MLHIWYRIRRTPSTLSAGFAALTTTAIFPRYSKQLTGAVREIIKNKIIKSHWNQGLVNVDRVTSPLTIFIVNFMICSDCLSSILIERTYCRCFRAYRQQAYPYHCGSKLPRNILCLSEKLQCALPISRYPEYCLWSGKDLPLTLLSNCEHHLFPNCRQKKTMSRPQLLRAIPIRL